MRVTAQPREGNAELSVSEATRRVKERLETSPELRDLWIRGELSNIRLHGGNLYFTLKDDASQLAAVYWGFGRGGRQLPPDGQAAIVHGRIEVYAARGQYQLIADDLLPAGAGELARRFEELKQKLHAEGLFAAARKVPLPAVPEGIAVLTSASTAALQDVLNVLRRRAPYARVVLFHCTVQGAAAPEEIICALEAADACPGIDVILLVRGGGSAEDLACFNDEPLARALAEVRRPVVSGIGHEIDFTIADFVADQRAPTPSAAAELVAPDAAELEREVQARGLRLAAVLQRNLEERAADLDRLFDRRLLRDVGRAVGERRQSLDEAAIRLVRAAARRTHSDRAGTPWAEHLLQRMLVPLQRRLDDSLHGLGRAEDSLLRALQARFERTAERLGALELKLKALNPRAPLEAGFALVRDSDGRLVHNADSVAAGAELAIELRRGSLRARRV